MGRLKGSDSLVPAWLSKSITFSFSLEAEHMDSSIPSLSGMKGQMSDFRFVFFSQDLQLCFTSVSDPRMHGVINLRLDFS